MDYNYARDYNPQIGRYVESDPMGLTAGFNTYAYVYGNPIMNTDRKGELPDPVDIISGAIFGFYGGYVASHSRLGGLAGFGAGAIIGAATTGFEGEEAGAFVGRIIADRFTISFIENVQGQTIANMVCHKPTTFRTLHIVKAAEVSMMNTATETFISTTSGVATVTKKTFEEPGRATTERRGR